MKKLISFFATQGIFSDLITILVIVVGGYSLWAIKREAFPNITYDMITVVTVFPGASPNETEKLITNPLERDLKEVDGVDMMISGSAENSSFIFLQLDPDQTTADDAKTDIQEVVDRFKDLPDGAEDPVVTSMETKSIPIIEIALSGDVPERTLRKNAKKLEDAITDIDEVARIEFNGLRDFEYLVEADMEKLRRYQISLEDLISAISRQNKSIPGGTLEPLEADGSKEVLIRTVGDYESVEDVKKTVIRANSLAQAIKVGDVADVYEDFEDSDVVYRTNGAGSLSLTVLKKETADAITLVDKVKDVVDSNKPYLSEGISVSYINDISYFVRRRLSVLSNNMLVGLALVLVVLSLMLPGRVAAVAAIGIPFSFLGAMIIFHNTSVSFNLISMMGLIIVIGMLVDDAIVVTENSERHIEEGKSPLEGAIAGTQEVWAPVTASVFTTVIAFTPLMFMSGISGKFIMNLPLGVVIALIISLWECFFVLPHHVARWVRAGAQEKRRGLGLFFSTLWETKMAPAYMRALDVVLKIRYLVAGFVFVLFVISIAVAVLFMDKILFPPGGIEAFQVSFEAPVGTPKEKTLELAKPLEKAVSKLPADELDDYTTKIGLQSIGKFDPNEKSGGAYGQILVYLTPATGRVRRAQEIVDYLRENTPTPEGLEKVSYSLLKNGPPVGKAISVGVRGRDYPKILAAIEDIKAGIENEDGVSDLTTTYVLGKEEIQIIVNEAEAAAAGLTVTEIGNSVRAAYEGIVASTIRDLDEEIDIRVRLKGAKQSEVEKILSVKIPNRQGNLVPLSQLASIKRYQGVASYEHEDGDRQVRLQGEVDAKKTSSEAINKKIEKRLPELREKHPDVTFNLSGEFEDTNESFESLGRAFVLAAIGIFFLLILLFKNIFQPLLVLCAIPLGVIAVIWAFFIHGQPLSFLGSMGMIALAGVIVNNGIVFVDFVNKRRQMGLDRFESIRAAGKVRIRPIFLTTLTTVAGILPTAYGLGGLDPFVVPIALAIGWGMLIGSILSTLAIPAGVAILDDIMLFSYKLFGKEPKLLSGN
jgi:multidrug efflux pump subunit AcrB